MTDPAVREGDPADLPRLREVQRALAEPWPELLATAADGPLPLFVLDDGAVRAYAIVVPDGEALAYVPEFAVHPAHHGDGYGSRLMDALRDRLAADGYECLRLTVRASDQRARSFYADHGFDRVERLPDYFADADGLLLGLALEG